MIELALAVRGLDHLVLAVDDLDAAGAHYEAMGFQVGGRNRHPWGTENRLVQFPGAFLELLAKGPGRADETGGSSHFLAGFERFRTARGQGFAFLVLESQDAEADRAAFDAAGIGGIPPLFFERIGRRPDGSTVRVAFSLAFAACPALPDAGFFVCQQHEPQNFWNPAFQVHPNGAGGLAGVVAVTEDARAPLPFLTAFSGAAPACIGERNTAIVTPRGAIETMTPACYRDVTGLDAPAPGAFATFKVFAPLDAMAARLSEAGLPAIRHRRHLAVPAEANFGAALIFEEPRRP